MNFLPDRGAKVRLPQGQGAPLYNAFPIILAAFSGNSGIIGRLHKEGDRVDDADDDGIMVLSGAAISNRVNMARLSIERGADGIMSIRNG